jgi:transcriptional regulator with XRE-family HTH domain
MSMSQTRLPATEEAEDHFEPVDEQESPTIGAILKRLRGKRSLRQVQADTGVPYTYLSSIELGQKNPGIKTLSRLAACYEVPVQQLLEAAGMQVFWSNPSLSSAYPESAPRGFKDNEVMTEIYMQRYYDFVMADPALRSCRKPKETPPVEFQRFVVEMYQHYTGKKLI